METYDLFIKYRNGDAVKSKCIKGSSACLDGFSFDMPFFFYTTEDGDQHAVHYDAISEIIVEGGLIYGRRRKAKNSSV